MSVRVLIKAVVVALSLLVVLHFGQYHPAPPRAAFAAQSAWPHAASIDAWSADALAAPAASSGGAAQCSDKSSPRARMMMTMTLANSSAAPNATAAGEEACSGAGVALANDTCAFVRSEACADNHELLDYLSFHYCRLGSAPALSFILLFGWLVVLLYMLGTTAEDHFCPALSHISDTLRLSPDVAGITILAFGNGSPDVFSIFAGVQQGNFDIALNELTGSGSFVTMCVVSAISLVSVARLERYPFLRDALFYFVAQAALCAIVYDGRVELWESVLLLVYYFSYVGFVIGVQWIRRRRAARAAAEAVDGELPVDSTRSLIDAPDSARSEDSTDDHALDWGSSRDVQSVLDSMKAGFGDDPMHADAYADVEPYAAANDAPGDYLSSTAQRELSEVIASPHSSEIVPAGAPAAPPSPDAASSAVSALAGDAMRNSAGTIPAKASSLSTRSWRYRAMTEMGAPADAEFDDEANDLGDGRASAGGSGRTPSLKVPSGRQRAQSISMGGVDRAVADDDDDDEGLAMLARDGSMTQRDALRSSSYVERNEARAADARAALAGGSERSYRTNSSGAPESDLLLSALRRHNRHHRRHHHHRHRQQWNEPAVLRRRGIHLDPLRHKVNVGDERHGKDHDYRHRHRSSMSRNRSRTTSRSASSAGMDDDDDGNDGAPAAVAPQPMGHDLLHAIKHRALLRDISQRPQLRPVQSGAAGAGAGAADGSASESDESSSDSESESSDYSQSGSFCEEDDVDDLVGPHGNVAINATALAARAHAFVARRPWWQRALRGVRRHAKNVVEWRSKSRFGRAVLLLTAPLHAMLWISVPHVEDGAWHRGVTSVTPFGATVVIILAMRLWSIKMGPVPLWPLLLFASKIVGAVLFRTSSKRRPPRYKLALVCLAFFISILWIYVTANELVALLKFFGVVFNISNGILGMTVLAWGNSIGDFVANTVVARQGFPEMAISAAFGGPLFNMVFGLGMSVTYANLVSYPAPLCVETMSTQTLTAFVFLSIGLLASLIVIPLTSFVIRKWFGLVLVLIYICATAGGIMAEFGVFQFNL